ncbi:MAG TPA: hypothetical protein VFQ77_15495 [Pseudonocardiaceae bacterium]|jgi:hypothetical protein|nr:hypothetical protein [Pseudonocardiaceae bacterium]
MSTTSKTATSRKSRYSLSPEERAERIAAARQQLLDGIDILMTADGWQQLITSRAWLRRYSLNNLIMILQQCPEATDVRPMSEWRQLGYSYMRKGTHKIKIWKPTFRPVEPTEDTGETAQNPGDQQSAQQALAGFVLVPVVDVSQLQQPPGRERPSIPAPIELQGDAPTGLWDGVTAQIRSRGYTVERGDCGTAYGRTIFPERRVIVRDGVEPAQAAKTLTHELAHILCDHESRVTSTPRPLREVEAESVACIVATACGLDTLSYSVPYVAGWARDRDTARESAERVLTVADTILAHLEGIQQRADANPAEMNDATRSDRQPSASRPAAVA